MKKSICFALSIFGCLSFAVIIASEAHPFKSIFGRAESVEHTLTLESGDTPASIGSSYANSVEGNVTTSNGNDVNLTFVNAKMVNGGFVQLANHGKIHNFNDENQQLTGINGISFTGSGSFVFKPAVSRGILPEITPVSVNAGGGKVTVPVCDFFEIEAGDSGATINSISFSYSCNPAAYDDKLANGIYTGVGLDVYTYKLTINNGSATFQSLDKASNTTINGSASLSSKTALSLSFTNLTYNFTYDGHSLTFVSKNGSLASSWPQISLDRVYNVEDFESYTTSGQGYTNSTTKYQTTGLRANYYADYYTGSSSGEIGGSGWPVMTSTDNSNYVASKGHNSSKGGIFKFSNGSSMRYIYMNDLYGVKRSIGKGAKLSFWARGAYTNSSFNTDHASGTSMKFYAYFNTPVTSSNQTSVRETFDFSVTAGSTWQHFEFPLTEGRTYYGFGFYAQQSSGSTQYIPIDDVKIYTASPYAEYVAHVPVSSVSVESSISIYVSGKQQLTPTISPSDATNKNVTWSSSNTSIATVDSDGTVHGVAAGTATITVASVSDPSKTASCTVTVNALAAHYPSGTYTLVITISKYNWRLIISFGPQASKMIAVRISTEDMHPGEVSYNSSNNTFTIPTTGSMSNYSVGNITGTYNYSTDKLTNVNCTGDLGSAVSNKTISHASGNLFFNCDGTTSTLQSKFNRRYRSAGASSWSVDSTNTDRIESDGTNYISGTSGLNVRPCGSSYDAYGFVMASDLSSAATVSDVAFWVYNPTDYIMKFRIYYYTSKNFANNGSVGLGDADRAQPHTWTYVSRGFGSKSIFNFTISVWTEDQTAKATTMAAKLTFDDIYFS